MELSARKVGPKVYTRESAQAAISACSWPDTVRPTVRSKNSRGPVARSHPITTRLRQFPIHVEARSERNGPCSLDEAGISAETVNCSPAPIMCVRVRWPIGVRVIVNRRERMKVVHHTCLRSRRR